jgi:hypothetical protein
MNNWLWNPLRQAGVPKSLIDLICRCTVKEPAKRTQNFNDIQQELSRTIASMSAVPTLTHEIPPSRTAPKTVGLRVYALNAVGVLGVIALFLLLARPKPPTVAAAPIVQPIVQPKDTASHGALLRHPAGDMVLVPVGQFLFGKDKETRTLPDFYIDKAEVTNQTYALYAKAKKAQQGDARKRQDDDQ